MADNVLFDGRRYIICMFVFARNFVNLKLMTCVPKWKEILKLQILILKFLFDSKHPFYIFLKLYIIKEVKQLSKIKRQVAIILLQQKKSKPVA